MAYYKKTFKAGDTLIVEKCFRGNQRAGGLRSRAKKAVPTREAVRKMNERNAVRKLTVDMNANFRRGDWHLVLTYHPDQVPNAEQARSNLGKFIRKLRAKYRKAGKELKYIHTTEYENKSIHHHILVNYHDLCEIQKAWPHGMVRPTPVYTVNLQELASYFIKETRKTFTTTDSPYKQRYIPSRNLVRPEPKIKLVMAHEWEPEPRAVQGYYLDKQSLVNGVNEVTGYPHQYYILVRLAPEKGG